jgi:hypothetical protein
MIDLTREIVSKTLRPLVSIAASILFLACGGTVESTSATAMNPMPRSASASNPSDGSPAYYSPSKMASRKVRSADLAQIDFPTASPRIQDPIELCLTKALRRREWNVAAHPFRIDLGRPSSPNVERLVKATFSDVRVTFDESCGQSGKTPSIEVLIRSANRDPYRSEVGGMQRTAVTLTVVFSAADGHEVWSHVYEAESLAKPAPRISGLFDGILFNGLLRTIGSFPPVSPERHRHAAREFGIALEIALREVHRALVEADEVRAHFDAPPPTHPET